MFGKSRAVAAALMAMAMMTPGTNRRADEIVFDEYSSITRRQWRNLKDWRAAPNTSENARRLRQIKAGWHPVVYPSEA